MVGSTGKEGEDVKKGKGGLGAKVVNRIGKGKRKVK